MYHGRGATDDKGPALSALFGARYAIEQGFRSTFGFSGSWKKKSAVRILPKD